MPAKPIYIVKLGETLPELLTSRGDFETWILAGLEAPAGDDTVVKCGHSFPAPEQVGGVVLTGSHDDVRKPKGKNKEWTERTAEWLPEIVRREIPLLGICYGHQLLAQAMGGQVADVSAHARGAEADGYPPKSEFGTVEVSLTKDAASDPLFRVLSNPTRFHVTHSQTVLQLPPGARLLASSERDPHQAFAVGTRAWGVQFHPEFDVEITKTYIDDASKKNGLAEQDDPKELKASCVKTPDAPKLLRRFAEIVEEFSES
jgi:GMP synthase (glutamine-hydrolysing)